jgi:hypothetical protein
MRAPKAECKIFVRKFFFSVFVFGQIEEVAFGSRAVADLACIERVKYKKKSF